MTETTARFRVAPITDRLELVHVDPSQGWVAGCTPFLQLDVESGEITLDTRMNSEDAVPMYVWHGRAIRVDMPPNVDPVALTYDINAGRFDDLFGRICDGTPVEWDGSNYTGRPSEDAQDARFELTERLLSYASEEIQGVIDAAEWIDETILGDEYGVTAKTTDDEVEQIAQRIRDDARAENVVLASVEHLITEYRSTLKND